jgi:hypothetical protein
VVITDRQLLHGHVPPSWQPRGDGVTIKDSRIVDHGRVSVATLQGDGHDTVRIRNPVIK